jgi:hypothetical protein
MGASIYIVNSSNTYLLYYFGRYKVSALPSSLSTVLGGLVVPCGLVQCDCASNNPPLCFMPNPGAKRNKRGVKILLPPKKLIRMKLNT